MYIPEAQPAEPMTSLSISQPEMSHPTCDLLMSDLRDECADSVLPFTLLGMSSDRMEPMAVTVRSSALQLRFMLLEAQDEDNSTLSELRHFYSCTAAHIEGERQEALTRSALCPWQHPGINYYYDHQHQQLMERVERSLALLESKLYSKSSSHTACDPIQPTIPTESGQVHTPSSETAPMKTPQPSRRHIKVCSPPLNPVAVRIMTSWYQRNEEHPYPSYETSEVMAKAGNITVEQVKKWFANRRRRAGNTKSLQEVAERRKRARTESCDLLLNGAKRSR